MAGDTIRLGMVVDATGARREIALTREELVKLANGGTLAQKAVAGVAQPLTQTTVAARAATDGFTRLRGPLTQIAISASGIPGPLGRVASVLSQFAFGGALTVGVMAGIAAIGIAWEKATAQSRKAREEWEKQLDLLQKLRREQELGAGGEAGAAVRAGRARLATLGVDIGSLSARVEAGRLPNGQLSGDALRALPLLRQKTEEYTRIALAVQAGETEVTRLVNDAETERARIRQQAIDKRIAEVRRETELVGRELAEQSRIAKEYAREFIALAAAKQFDRDLIRSASGDTSGFGFKMDPFQFNGDISAVTAIKRREAEQKLAQGAAIGAIGGIASQVGPFGGVASGGLGALAAGAGPMGIASAAASGLIDGLIGMADASQRAAEKARALSLAFKAWVDAAEFELGRISAAENAARNTARDANAQRGAALGLGPLSAAEAEKTLEALRRYMTAAEAGEARKRLDEINKLEKELTDHRRKEADEMERLATAYRNAPRGFFVEAYLGGVPRGPGGHDTVTGPVGTMPTGGGTRVTPQIIVSEGAIVVNGVTDPVRAAQLVVQGLTIIGSASGSTGGSRSRTLDLM